MKTSNKLLTGLLIFIAVSIFSFVLLGRLSMENFETHKIKGNGEISEQYRESPAFTGLKVGSGIQVNLTKGENVVNLKADGNLLEFIETTVKDDVLSIRWKDGTDADITQPVQANIALPRLEYLNVSSNASVKTTDNFTGGNVHFDASSGSDVTLQGWAVASLDLEASSNAVAKFEQGINAETEAKLDLSSGSEVYFQSLKTEKVDAKMSSNAVLKMSGSATSLQANGSSGGSLQGAAFVVENTSLQGSSGAQFEVEVNVALQANLSSGATVRYRGNANVAQNTNGGGSVQKVD